MASSTVARRGTDSSGRGIYASDYMWAWWLRVCDTLGFTPTVVQGAWMVKAGGGATASAGYHDAGGSFDLRTWDLTSAQVEQVIRTTRTLGAGSWVRDQRHGMDPHIHFVLGSDYDLASGARTQWGQYLAGRDGLASNGPDYHWRPSPMVTTPPQEDDELMSAADDIIQAIRDEGQKTRERISGSESRERGRDIAQHGALRDILAGLASDVEVSPRADDTEDKLRARIANLRTKVQEARDALEADVV